MKREELDRVLSQHRLWLETSGDEGERADLGKVGLRNVYLRFANLRDADLLGADLRDANLQSAYLQGADFKGANLQGANLQGADFKGADLRGAKFDTNIRNCWRFYMAKFTSDALPWLILHPRWAEWKDSVQIEGA
jgi:uncharacterized protein YjbI with pentapeptide repeats